MNELFFPLFSYWSFEIVLMAIAAWVLAYALLHVSAWLWNKKWPRRHKGLLCLFASISFVPCTILFHSMAAKEILDEAIHTKGAPSCIRNNIARMFNQSVYRHLCSAIETMPPGTETKEAARNLYSAYLSHLADTANLPFDSTRAIRAIDEHAEAIPYFSGIYRHRSPAQLDSWLTEEKYRDIHRIAADHLAQLLLEQNRQKLQETAAMRDSLYSLSLMSLLLSLSICCSLSYQDIKKIRPYYSKN